MNNKMEGMWKPLVITAILTAIALFSMIEDTYHSSIQTTIDLALETTEEIEEDAELGAAKEEEESGGLFSGADVLCVACENTFAHY